MPALENRKLRMSVIIFIVVVVALLTLTWKSVTNAEENPTIANNYGITIVESPAEFEKPTEDCFKVTSKDGQAFDQSCFPAIGQICSMSVPIAKAEGSETGYWINLDRRSNCTATFRIGVPDIGCHIIVPNDQAIEEVSVDCFER